MHIGYIGLGKMGKGMVELLLEKGYTISVYDENETTLEEVRRAGARPFTSLSDMVQSLPVPRLVWLMVPHEAVDAVLDRVVPACATGDTIIDGGNSPFKDSMRRGEAITKKGIHFLDAGVSGGPKGAREGACVMVGGDKDVYKTHEQLFQDIAAPEAYLYAGESGAGHFVKMVHNGIEYGMMQSLAEGFTVLKESPFDLHLTEVARLYNHRSVIESRLVGWLVDAFNEFGEQLEDVSGAVAHTGEGKWTIEAARELDVAVPVIKKAFDFRIESQKEPSYTGKILSALRNQFGRHAVS